MGGIPFRADSNHAPTDVSLVQYRDGCRYRMATKAWLEKQRDGENEYTQVINAFSLVSDQT
jgi:hypothetical protein